MIVKFVSKEEWLNWRTGKIGSSDCPVILGINKYKSKIELWEEKLGLKAQPIENENMRRGVYLEPLAQETFEKENKLSIKKDVFVSDEFDWMNASLDGWGYENGKTFLVEIKCPSMNTHLDTVEKGTIPRMYYAQIQHQLYVTKFEYAYYYSFDGEKGFSIKVEPDQKFWDEMILEEKAFYGCLTNLIRPDDVFGIVEYRSDDDFKVAAEEYISAKEAYQPVKKRLEDAEERLKELSKEKSSEGFGVKIKYVKCIGNIDYKKVPELKHVNLEPYRKENIFKYMITKQI